MTLGCSGPKSLALCQLTFRQTRGFHFLDAAVERQSHLRGTGWPLGPWSRAGFTEPLSGSTCKMQVETQLLTARGVGARQPTGHTWPTACLHLARGLRMVSTLFKGLQKNEHAPKRTCNETSSGPWSPGSSSWPSLSPGFEGVNRVTELKHEGHGHRLSRPHSGSRCRACNGVLGVSVAFKVRISVGQYSCAKRYFQRRNL